MIAFIHPASLDHRRRGGRHGRRPVDLVSGAGRTVAGAGEVDAARLDIATRVDGRVADIPVERGQNVAAGAVLVKIDNPEKLAKNEQALAANFVAKAQLANINVGTRVEVIAMLRGVGLRAASRRCPRDFRRSGIGRCRKAG